MDHSYNHNGYSTTHTAATSATATPMRPGSPDSAAHDFITPMPKGQGPGTNPFSSPFASGRASVNASSSALNIHHGAQQSKYFHSRRVKKGEIERPWLDKKDPREKWVTIIPLIGLGLGFALAAFLVYDGLKTVVKHDYCPVLDEDFSRGWDDSVWTKESEVGGFGYVEQCSSIHDLALTSIAAMANSSRPPPPMRTYSSKAENCTSSPHCRTRT